MKELDALMNRKTEFEKQKQKAAFSRAGIISSVIANCHRDKKKRKKPYKPKDFMPQEERKTGQIRSWKDQLKKVEMLNVMFGGKDERGGAA